MESKEYLIKVTVKNNVILRAMKNAGFESASQLAKAIGVHPTQVGEIMNFKKSAVGRRGKIREIVERISAALGVTPEELFPKENFALPLVKNTAEIEASLEDIQTLDSRIKNTNPLALLEDADRKRNVREVLATLPEREEEIIKARFGIDCEEKTLDELAQEQGITCERVRQIESKALARLKHPSRRALLVESNTAYPST